MKVLQLAINQLPNIGGLESHLANLVSLLLKENHKVFILSYQPLSTRTRWKVFEKKGPLTNLRIPWIRGLFERLVNTPILEFIYIVPGLFILTPFVFLYFRPEVIHAHGLVPAVSAVFWGKLFKRRVVISLHSIYSFPKKGIYYNFVTNLLDKCDVILTISRKSYDEVSSLGIKRNKIRIFTYWIDLTKYQRVKEAKKRLRLRGDFVVLYVGRLIKEKGIKELLQSSSHWNKDIDLVIAGVGPLEQRISKIAYKSNNVHFLGGFSQNNLPLLYSAADLLIFPSINEEGFGRVIIESLACSTPVLASNRGSIYEVINENVGKVIDINPGNIKKWVEYFYQHKNKLRYLARNARKFAERKYSEKNGKKIIRSYTE